MQEWELNNVAEVFVDVSGERVWAALPLPSDPARCSGNGCNRLTPGHAMRTLKFMEVRFTPDQEAQLSQIATHAGTDTEHLVKSAALRLVEENARFRGAVREGVAQADRGELVDDDEVRLWLEQQERS
jgi:predicted transcriptional regulator